jgi:tetratricopeptide (TPR) repeat protein
VILVGSCLLAACGGTHHRVHEHAPALEATAAKTPSLADPANDAALAEALEELDEALLMRLDPEAAAALDEALAEVRVALREACSEQPDHPLCRGALTTVDVLAGWQALAENQRLSGYAQDPALVEALAGTHGPLQELLLSLIERAPGELPQTDVVAVSILFEQGRRGEAADLLRQVLERQTRTRLEHRPTHALVRSWRDALVDPLAVAGALTETDHMSPDIAQATLGYLHLAAGLAAQARLEHERAAELFEQGAGRFELAVGRDPLDSEWNLTLRRADCLVNAGWEHFGLARTAIEEERPLEEARPHLLAAESDFGAALEAIPEDADARQGLALTGDLYYQAGSEEGIRDFFGRVAERFDLAEWWNNYAFFCRETGLYEESYAAYSRCIELAPDNARWVNDTGLILLYHLDRDLDHAEELFHRSWELGREACDNPFVSDEAYEENFSAYTDAMLNLALLYARRDELQRASNMIVELRELDPLRPDAIQLQAQIASAISGEDAPEEN